MATFLNLTSNPQNPLSPQSPSTDPDNGFALFAIAVLAISATAFLLLASYYFFATKCYVRCRRSLPSSHVSGDRAQGHEDEVPAYTDCLRGIDGFLIREIPAFLYIKNDQERSSFLKCVLCLNEFQEHDMLRISPTCGHAFHLDCTDVWLQSNSNCPSCNQPLVKNGHRLEKILAPNYLSQGDFLVIEISGEDGTDKDQEISGSSRRHSARNLEKKMGDKGRDVTEKYEEFPVPSVRRSLSMDSALDAPVRRSLSMDSPLDVPLRRSISMDSVMDAHVHSSIER